jgi:hypothetical protein
MHEGLAAAHSDLEHADLSELRIRSKIRQVGNSAEVSTCGEDEVMQCRQDKLQRLVKSKYAFRGASRRNDVEQ